MADSLVLDIGGDIGALVIHTGPELDSAEIELSPVGFDHQRFHNQVHARHLPDGVRHNAVFPRVHAGEYRVWRDHDTVHGTVRIEGGQVAEYTW
ncbi:phospholipase [Kutzneria kofuensis]|uniref:Phospholipase n=1 Tax=Kutzneria kofuensis TaxID=103725 RepID=A0A7W9KNF7_9PSEU|nr:phospholipase [Kutzneria kofuensis]MBB5895690.1 hypothetical protein [Kutzneria kofuensis]